MALPNLSALSLENEVAGTAVGGGRAIVPQTTRDARPEPAWSTAREIQERAHRATDRIDNFRHAQRNADRLRESEARVQELERANRELKAALDAAGEAEASVVSRAAREIAKNREELEKERRKLEVLVVELSGAERKLKEAVRELTADLRTSQGELERMRAALAAADEQVGIARADLEEREVALTVLVDSLKEAEATGQQTYEELNQTKERATDLAKHLNETKKRALTCEEELKRVRMEVEKKKSEVQDAYAKAEIERGKYAESTDRLRECEANAKESEDAIEQLIRRIGELEAELEAERSKPAPKLAPTTEPYAGLDDAQKEFLQLDTKKQSFQLLYAARFLQDEAKVESMLKALQTFSAHPTIELYVSVVVEPSRRLPEVTGYPFQVHVLFATIYGFKEGPGLGSGIHGFARWAGITKPEETNPLIYVEPILSKYYSMETAKRIIELFAKYLPITKLSRDEMQMFKHFKILETFDFSSTSSQWSLTWPIETTSTLLRYALNAGCFPATDARLNFLTQS